MGKVIKMTINIPKKFVSLHNHTGFSTFDGLGYPDEHINFAIENGLDAFAITEHGHMNSYAHAQLYYEKLKKEGKRFKYIPGAELYFHPDLDQWKNDKIEWENKKNLEKEQQKAIKKLKEKQEIKTEIILKRDSEDEVVEIDLSETTTIENEEETKNFKYFNPLNRRHHLVVLPKNSNGLLKIFKLVSKGYLEGFYRFPRIDTKMLKEAGENGDIIVSTACLGSYIAFEIFQILKKNNLESLSSNILDDYVTLEKCKLAVGNVYDVLSDCVGKNNCFLELQFNKLPAQNLINRAIISFAKQSGLENQLIVAGDSHYARPEHWKEREMYKKLGYINHQTFDSNSLPQSPSELKAELYPKNANQIWQNYLESKEADGQFYEDNLIISAIERTHEIAHNYIDEVIPDRKIKIPTSIVPKKRTAISFLTELCIQGMKDRGLSQKQEYVARLREELEIIKKLEIAEYFITLKKILDIARSHVLLGFGRGSGVGSLVNYVLRITDVDPIEFGLLFSRFLSVHRKGLPDVDCDVSDRDKVLSLLRDEFGNSNVVPISNYNTFKLKTLIKDISKFYGIPFEEVNNAVKEVDKEVMKAKLKPGDDKATFVLTFEDALKYSVNFRNFIEKYSFISESVGVLFKQIKSNGRHAGGVLVCDDLMAKMPLITSSGEPQTPWVEGLSFKHLEEIGGFIKYDILGLGTLRLFERTIELIIKRSRGRKIIVELSNRQVLNLFENDKILLEDGNYRFAKNLTDNDDIKYPPSIIRA
jgi:DNA polymerase-3 subunit alpha